MPNYGLVVTPTYNPMSYEQYVKPFQDYAQVYNATADQIDALEMEANQWEKLANNEADAPQYATYKKYADDLRGFANALANEGLSTRTRAGLSGMRRRYTKEIMPIETAYNYREKLAEEQRKLNPTGDMQFTVDYSTIGLTPIMNNPNLGYKSRSLSEMEQEAMTQAAAASERKVVTQKAKNMGGQYFQILQGYGQEAAKKFLAEAKKSDPKTYKELVDIYNQVRKSYGTTADNSPYSIEQNAIADDRILNGMMKGLSLKSSYQANRGYDYAMERRASTGSGGVNSSNTSEHIGYETVTRDADGKVKGIYTVVDEGGVIKYYKHNPDGTTSTTPLTPEQARAEGLGETPINARYYTAPHNTNADLVYVMDANTGMKVTQDGKVVTYNRNTQRWNPITKRVEDLPGKANSKKKVPRLPSPMKVVVSNSNNSTKTKNKPGYNENLTSKEAQEAVSGTTPKTFEELNHDELIQVPDIVKQNPGGYLFYSVKEDGNMWWTGDNTVLYIVPTAQNVAEESGEEELDNEID